MFGLIAAGIAASPLHAATDRYDYDALGRLIRRIDDQNRTTDYNYDAAGNITHVSGGGMVEPLTVTTTTLGDLRQNETRQFSISGTGLIGVNLRTADPRIAVSEVVVSADAIFFRLSVAANAPLGAQAIFVENSSGSVAVSLNVVPVLAFLIAPTPITVPPDGIARRFTLQLSEPLAEAMSFSLSTLSPTIAKPNSTLLNLAPGQAQADLGVIGLTQGVTVLRLRSADLLQAIESLVFVSPGAANPANYSNRVVVLRGYPWGSAGINGFGNAVSSIVVHRGAFPWILAPAGSDSVALRIQRWVPWTEKASNALMLSPFVRVVRQ